MSINIKIKWHLLSSNIIKFGLKTKLWTFSGPILQNPSLHPALGKSWLRAWIGLIIDWTLTFKRTRIILNSCIWSIELIFQSFINFTSYANIKFFSPKIFDELLNIWEQVRTFNNFWAKHCCLDIAVIASRGPEHCTWSSARLQS